MKKIFFTLTILTVFGLITPPVFGATFTSHNLSCEIDTGGKKKAISIGSNRASGDMLLHFTADKDGEATITISDESGKIVLQQTNEVRISINSIPLKNATVLKEGSYTVRVISNNETYFTRFLIWK